MTTTLSNITLICSSTKLNPVQVHSGSKMVIWFIFFCSSSDADSQFVLCHNLCPKIMTLWVFKSLRKSSDYLIPSILNTNLTIKRQHFLKYLFSKVVSCHLRRCTPVFYEVCVGVHGSLGGSLLCISCQYSVTTNTPSPPCNKTVGLAGLRMDFQSVKWISRDREDHPGRFSLLQHRFLVPHIADIICNTPCHPHHSVIKL